MGAPRCQVSIYIDLTNDFCYHLHVIPPPGKACIAQIRYVKGVFPGHSRHLTERQPCQEMTTRSGLMTQGIVGQDHHIDMRCISRDLAPCPHNIPGSCLLVTFRNGPLDDLRRAIPQHLDRVDIAA